MIIVPPTRQPSDEQEEVVVASPRWLGMPLARRHAPVGAAVLLALALLMAGVYLLARS